MPSASSPAPDSDLTAGPKPAETTDYATPDAPAATGVFTVGGYLVGDAEDELLSGHPDIRY